MLLCCCASTIGAYALFCANLNLTAKVGYVSFNCTANIAAKITGSSTTAGGAIADKNIEQIAVTGKNNQVQTMDLGTFYFTDTGVKNASFKPSPIKIWFTIENTSEFPICVDVSLPTIADVEVVADKTSHVIQANTTDFIMVTMTITNLETRSLETAVTISDFGLTLKKFLFTKGDIPVYKDSSVTHFENHPYYINFGKYYNGTDIYWLVGGTMDSNGQTVALTNEDRVQLDTGKMALDKDYYLICGTSLYGTTKPQVTILPYQNNFCYTDTTGYLIDYPEVTNLLDYSLSVARQFLNEHTVVIESIKDRTNKTVTPVSGGVTSLNHRAMWGLVGDIYSLIQKRDLSAIYKTLGYGNSEIEIPTEKVDNLSGNEADAFWLPTLADIDVLGNDYQAFSLSSGGDSPYGIYTHSLSSDFCKHYYVVASGKGVLYLQSDANYQGYKYRPAFIL